MQTDNIRVTIDSQQHYWNDLIAGLDTLLALQHKQKIPSEVISAVSHFKLKLDKALTVSLTPETVIHLNPTTVEDMTAAYHDSFTN